MEGSTATTLGAYDLEFVLILKGGRLNDNGIKKSELSLELAVKLLNRSVKRAVISSCVGGCTAAASWAASAPASLSDACVCPAAGCCGAELLSSPQELMVTMPVTSRAE